MGEDENDKVRQAKDQGRFLFWHNKGKGEFVSKKLKDFELMGGRLKTFKMNVPSLS